MTDKIFILEPSKTMQKEMRLSLAERTPVFFEDFLAFMGELSAATAGPAAVLVNAETENPSAFEIVRLVKTLSCMNKVPVALYSIQNLAYEDFLRQNSTADYFFRYEAERFEDDIAALLKLAETEPENFPTKAEISKNAIIRSLYGMIKTWDRMENVSRSFMSILAEYLHVPAVCLFIQEDDGTHPYCIANAAIPQGEVSDFLAVCRTDFESLEIDKSGKLFATEFLGTRQNLDDFYVRGVGLSAYHYLQITGQDKKPFATVHVISQSAFSTMQLNLLYYCAENAGPLLENALMLKRKLFFEKRIRRAFSRFVPEQIIDELVAQTDAQDKISVGEKREVAVLFSDIRSFTNISERNKPEVIVSFLNRYFTIMVEIIKKHGGTIDKFIGDAIMALFGAPVSYEDNARRAVAAAYEMREALPSIPLDDLVLPEGMKFDIGIGINYGDLIVGSIGSKDKTDYSVIGDSVNLASRLEGLTKTYGAKILVSKSVKDDIKEEDEFVFRYLDDVKVKGKEVAVPIFAVDVSREDFSELYRDSYKKGMELYKQGVFTLAKEYFEKALGECAGDKASLLMISRCAEFIENPPERWDGAIAFKTK